jgi:hypothetical protein
MCRSSLGHVPGVPPRSGARLGRQSFYALVCPELLDLLRAAENVLAGTGNAVALCPTYGEEAGQ